MVTEKSWKEFQDAGLLWWINRILHTFGWAIVLVLQADGSITNAYPARVKFRGFGEEIETKGFRKVSAYLEQNIKELKKEAEEEE